MACNRCSGSRSGRSFWLVGDTDAAHDRAGVDPKHGRRFTEIILAFECYPAAADDDFGFDFDSPVRWYTDLYATHDRQQCETGSGCQGGIGEIEFNATHVGDQRPVE